MEILRNIVQNILVIMLLTILLEMLLPEGDMRRYIRLVMGLFVITAVLNPVLSIFHRGINLDIVNFNGVEQQAGLTTAVARGKELAAQQKAQALAGLREKINGQVLAMARLNKTVNVTGVEVKMDEDPQSRHFGAIKQITLTTGAEVKTPGKAAPGAPGGPPGSPGSPGSPEVAPVEINLPDVGSARSQDKVTAAPDAGGKEKELQEILADFYGLAPEQIKIVR